jgi:outer membrane lipoprotein-sorting protein
LKVLLGTLLALSASGGFHSDANPAGFAGKSGGSKTGGIKSGKAVETEVSQALSSLRQKSGVAVPVKKKSLNGLLGKEKTSEGRLFYWQGKLRLETDAPEETILVLDGKTLWLATKLPEEMGGKTMVSKTSARNFKKSNTLIAALLENKKLLKEFKLDRRSDVDGEVHLEFAAKKPDENEIQRLALWLRPAAKRLEKITYWDDKENEVTFTLGEIKSIDGDRKALFSYKPPKGAEITEFE